MAVLAIALTGAISAQSAAAAPPPLGGDLGPNVIVFTPDMPQAQIQAKVDAIAAQQVDSEMGTGRYALLFAPGTYGTPANPLRFQVGYDTEVAGLGASPDDVTINGSVDVYNRCFTDGSGCIALDNFWRSVSNLHIAVAGGSGCQTNTEFWAVSQAAPMRRVDVTGGGLSFMDYCTAGPQYASGGFVADSKVSATAVNGSQQQFYTRDSTIGGWSNAVWNQVFSGVQGAPAQSFPNPPYTTLMATPASREKPYLVQGGDGLSVVVPPAKTNSSGTTWAAGGSAGRVLPLSTFFVAKPGDSVSRINAALAGGKNLLLTPGVYSIDQSIRVKRAGTVVLGLGLATLTADTGSTPLAIDDVPGVDVAGITVDAGAVNSPVLVQVGTEHQRGRGGSSAADPISLQDVFLRIGGPHEGKATVGVQVDSDHVLLDDLWLWRADHGTGVGWTRNTSDTGLIVNGDDVTATGLFVEHFQKDNVIWNGEDGRTVFFQNELPYDAPDQAAWQHDGVLGYPAYKVADTVLRHELWGAGSYIYTNVDPTLHASHAFEVPVTPGVTLHDLSTVSLNGAGTIDHVVNETGGAVTPTHQGPETVTTYGG
ncbi:adenylyl cyclase [Leifsonia sp. AG29]|uniref:adenylyl cyclase n=1 Tax=Leifsonia sp. AG29 TaxID=2598860 RepID=UPI002D7F4C4D|nr:adenylyl cyclase [Leifsonia sp. AG29]